SEVYRYRRYVDDHIERLLGRADEEALRRLSPVLVLGLNHEQQHQELILTDIKHAFGSDPLRPAYPEQASPPAGVVMRVCWLPYPAGERWVGHAGGGFAFDNETPRHRQLVGPYQLASRLVTNGEYLGFVADRGYERPDFWLSDGWDACRAHSWAAP